MIVFKILFSFCILILAVRAEGETVGSSKALNPVLAVPNDNGNRTIQGYSEGCESDKVATGEQLECTHVDQCYPPHQRCDGKYHCTDESDEIGCVCTAEQFSCKADDKCINKEFVCNGYEDCSDGADETGYCALYKDQNRQIESVKDKVQAATTILEKLNDNVGWIRDNTRPLGAWDHLQIRIVDSAGRTRGFFGRVEVLYKGQWGTVCDDWADGSYDWGAFRAGNVICRMFGRPGGMAFEGDGTGNPNLPILWDNVKCRGNEMSIFDCPKIEHAEGCNHGEDLRVACD